jgi:hypothetical protein
MELADRPIRNPSAEQIDRLLASSKPFPGSLISRLCDLANEMPYNSEGRKICSEAADTLDRSERISRIFQNWPEIEKDTEIIFEQHRSEKKWSTSFIRFVSGALIMMRYGRFQ